MPGSGRGGRQRRICAGKRSRSRGLEYDADLLQYLNFFYSPLKEENAASLCDEPHFLEFDQVEAGREIGQEVEIEWDSNQAEKAMDDRVIVVDDDKTASYTGLHEQFDQSSRNDDATQEDLERSRFPSESGSHSPPSVPLNLARHSSDERPGKSMIEMKQTCVVCNGEANGYHFGALSCAACNAFFRRSIAESRKYCCRKTGECTVDQSARCFCRACRLKKCLECGMDPSAVQPHRDMLGQKRRGAHEEQKTDSENSGTGSETASGSDLKMDDTKDILRGHAKSFFQNGKDALKRHFSSLTAAGAPTIPCNISAFRSPLLHCTDDAAKKPKCSESVAAHHLDSSNFLAESLLAFSKVPSAGSICEDVLAARSCEIAHNRLATYGSDAKQAAPSVCGVRVLEAALGADSQKRPGVSLLTTYLSNLVDGRKMLNDQRSSCFGLQQQSPSSSTHRSNSNDFPAISSGWLRDAEASARHHSVASLAKNAATPLAPKAPYDASKNTIETLTVAYSRLRERRRLLYARGTLRDILAGDELPLRACEIDSFASDIARMDMGLVIEFVSCIHPFTKLRLDDRVALVKNAFFSWFTLERHYITMRGGGLQANRIINIDHSYYDLAPLDEEADFERSGSEVQAAAKDKEKERPAFDRRSMSRIFLPMYREALRDITGAMYHSDVTDAEIVALAVIVFLDHAAPNVSDVGKWMLKEARDRMYFDWFAYYDAHSITNGAERVGNALLLLPSVYIASKRLMESYRMANLSDMFDMASLAERVLQGSYS